MVNVVNGAATVTDVDQGLHDGQNVVTIQNHFTAVGVATFNLQLTYTAVELHATDARQVVTVRVEEQAVEQFLGRFVCRRLAGTHHAVDFNQCTGLITSRIGRHGFRDERTLVQFVGVDTLELGDLGFTHHFQQLRRNRRVTGRNQLARFLVDQIVCDDFANQILVWNRQASDFSFL